MKNKQYLAERDASTKGFQASTLQYITYGFLLFLSLILVRHAYLTIAIPNNNWLSIIPQL
jgi:hypothetical protein